MNFLRKVFFHSPVRYIIAVILSAAIMGIALITRGHATKLNYVDAISTGGAVTFLIGCLILIVNFGTFDIFSYSFSNFGKKKYKDLFTYSEMKKEEREKNGMFGCVPFMVVGLLFIIVSLLIWYL